MMSEDGRSPTISICGGRKSAGSHAVIAGRLAYLSGRIPRKSYATASSPIEGMVGR